MFYFTNDHSQSHFFIQLKGENAGKPLKHSIPNSIGVVANTKVLVPEYFFYVVQYLFNVDAFKPFLKGSVIPFIRQRDIIQVIEKYFVNLSSKSDQQEKQEVLSLVSEGSPMYSKKKVFEFTLPGFDGGTDETDHHIIWVGSDNIISAEMAMYLNGHLRFINNGVIGEVGNFDSACIDYFNDPEEHYNLARKEIRRLHAVCRTYREEIEETKQRTSLILTMVKDTLVQMAINSTFPMDMNELDLTQIYEDAETKLLNQE